MKYWIYTLGLLALFSCSNLSKNVVKKGSLEIAGGVHHNYSWKEGLKLKRFSWYHELSLLYEVLFSEVTSSSPFYNWFSNGEKELLGSCKSSLVALSYQLDSSRLDHTLFLEQAKLAGYEKIAIPNFKKSLRLHPDVEGLSLQLYDAFALCRKEIPDESAFFIRFPSFKEIRVH